MFYLTILHTTHTTSKEHVFHKLKFLPLCETKDSVISVWNVLMHWIGLWTLYYVHQN